MRRFHCSQCNSRVFFENTRCLTCGSAIGFLPETLSMATTASGGQDLHQYCANAAHKVCNWLVPAAIPPDTLCVGCALSRIIPNLSEAGNQQAWRRLNQAKKHLLYSIFRFGLALGEPDRPGGRLTFDFMKNSTTGHLDGVITVDVREADAAERERQREMFQEPYRTLLGHLRHESGHFYWLKLVEHGRLLEPFRDLFGDERQPYGDALTHYHKAGPPADHAARHISAYASAHPWEDWAETWAHYMHMVAVVDAAEAEGMEPRAGLLSLGMPWPFATFDAYRERSFPDLLDRWLPLTISLNALSRSMGHVDFYPFALGETAIQKLAFVHQAIRTGAETSGR
jgi:hypothetical protein